MSNGINGTMFDNSYSNNSQALNLVAALPLDAVAATQTATPPPRIVGYFQKYIVFEIANPDGTFGLKIGKEVVFRAGNPYKQSDIQPGTFAFGTLAASAARQEKPGYIPANGNVILPLREPGQGLPYTPVVIQDSSPLDFLLRIVVPDLAPVDPNPVVRFFRGAGGGVYGMTVSVAEFLARIAPYMAFSGGHTPLTELSAADAKSQVAGDTILSVGDAAARIFGLDPNSTEFKFGVLAANVADGLEIFRLPKGSISVVRQSDNSVRLAPATPAAANALRNMTPQQAEDFVSALPQGGARVLSPEIRTIVDEKLRASTSPTAPAARSKLANSATDLLPAVPDTPPAPRPVTTVAQPQPLTYQVVGPLNIPDTTGGKFVEGQLIKDPVTGDLYYQYRKDSGDIGLVNLNTKDVPTANARAADRVSGKSPDGDLPGVAGKVVEPPKRTPDPTPAQTRTLPTASQVEQAVESTLPRSGRIDPQVGPKEDVLRAVNNYNAQSKGPVAVALEVERTVGGQKVTVWVAYFEVDPKAAANLANNINATPTYKVLNIDKVPENSGFSPKGLADRADNIADRAFVDNLPTLSGVTINPLLDSANFTPYRQTISSNNAANIAGNNLDNVGFIIRSPDGQRGIYVTNTSRGNIKALLNNEIATGRMTPKQANDTLYENGLGNLFNVKNGMVELKQGSAVSLNPPSITTGNGNTTTIGGDPNQPRLPEGTGTAVKIDNTNPANSAVLGRPKGPDVQSIPFSNPRDGATRITTIGEFRDLPPAMQQQLIDNLPTWNPRSYGGKTPDQIRGLLDVQNRTLYVVTNDKGEVGGMASLTPTTVVMPDGSIKTGSYLGQVAGGRNVPGAGTQATMQAIQAALDEGKIVTAYTTGTENFIPGGIYSANAEIPPSWLQVDPSARADAPYILVKKDDNGNMVQVLDKKGNPVLVDIKPGTVSPFGYNPQGVDSPLYFHNPDKGNTLQGGTNPNVVSTNQTISGTNILGASENYAVSVTNRTAVIGPNGTNTSAQLVAALNGNVNLVTVAPDQLPYLIKVLPTGDNPTATLYSTNLKPHQNVNTVFFGDRKSTRLNSSHSTLSRMPSSA